jgi:hypothetical protein
MFDQLMDAAERTATSVSRRQFFGRFGRMAVMAAGVVGGLLAIPTIAEAGSSKCCCAGPDCYRNGNGNAPCATGYHACGCRHACS